MGLLLPSLREGAADIRVGPCLPSVPGDGRDGRPLGEQHSGVGPHEGVSATNQPRMIGTLWEVLF